ncbi:MAG: T9SS type A sorting domain-containing protein [bacterium]|nr:T9SS type A sorting domain-containing protein [bacterium]MDD5756898.1 T9SS type A sorting domain-containing protein [bacterium]
MRKRIKILISIISILILSISAYGASIVINHTCVNLTTIPSAWVDKARQDLHIAYGHTSHGSQLTTGMTGLVTFKGQSYAYNSGGTGDALDLRESISGASDLGNPDFTAWESATRDYLDAHSEINVIIWSWCGQVSSASQANINTYLNLMDGLEDDYPNVKFVYMTGHLDGGGLTGNLHLRNQQIRDYCNANDKILYDFEDIESYDPDGTYFGDKNPDDGCNYDSDGNGSRDGNWAEEWQDAHTEGVDWYNCSAAHSQPLNANQKAYGAWWLWARLAGWDGVDTIVPDDPEPEPALPGPGSKTRIHPNPCKNNSRVYFRNLQSRANVDIYDLSGNLINEVDKNNSSTSLYWDLTNKEGGKIASGIYFYVITYPDDNNRIEKGKIAVIR